jgi:lysophospholipase L1-like esterase
MRKIKISTTFGCILLLFISLPNEIAVAQNKSTGVTKASNAAFELKDGDRVVFLGNSLFENDLQYGYLELALTTRWPNRNVTYRNIGWTGDTVFGEARTYITSPSGYELLIEQLTKAQPTIVFIAYGAIEAYEGEAGVSRFSQGLNQLLDKIDQLGAKAVLLSPVPTMSAGSTEDLVKRNAMLELYASAIAKTASDRGKRFIDIFNPLLEDNKNAKLSDNGFHLNENGYYYLASTIEKGLGLAPRSNEPVVINVSKHAVEAAAPAKVLDSGKNNGNIKFTIDEGYLPLPLPENGGGAADNVRVLKITGLKRGFYTLTTDNSQVITASAKKWKEGVEIRRGPSFNQVSQLREKIIKKNELFFHQYRPLNRTYLVGFRRHEQVPQAKAQEDLGIIITWLEGQIALNCMPKSQVYQLTEVK